MVGFTPKEVFEVREALAAAHVFLLSISPILKRRHVALDRSQRLMMQNLPILLSDAFETLARVEKRNNCGAVDGSGNTNPLFANVEFKLMRDELENVSALVLPDLVFEMVCACGELPMFRQIVEKEKIDNQDAGQLMAWAWEAGRRYGVNMAIELVDANIEEFRFGTMQGMANCLNSTLELPPPERSGWVEESASPKKEDSEGDGAPAADNDEEVQPFLYPDEGNGGLVQ